MGAAPGKAKQSAVRRTFRLLGNKEKKELRAYAHQLGDDICVHQDVKLLGPDLQPSSPPLILDSAGFVGKYDDLLVFAVPVVSSTDVSLGCSNYGFHWTFVSIFSVVMDGTDHRPSQCQEASSNIGS
ncbi:unnamed protein product [Sphagnum jensenii]|uniref:Uncharacterized protein n=1 Tax=Sphagnum jensenii TaxID=128206 RepID=A0ABP1BMH0_9BRYO